MGYKALAFPQGNGKTGFGHKRDVSDGNVLAIDFCDDPKTRLHLERGGLTQIDTFGAGASHDGPAQRMLAAQLRRCQQRIEPGSARSIYAARYNSADLRFSFSNSACLIEYGTLDARKALKRIPFLHQKPVLGCVAYSGHDSRGRRQHERARAKDHQHGDGTQDLACDHVHRHGRSERANHDPCRPAVCQTHDLRLAGIGVLHQTRHALNGAVLAWTRSPNIDCTELVECARGHFAAWLLVLRHGLAGDRAFIDACAAAHHHAVDRNRLARQHAHERA